MSDSTIHSSIPILTSGSGTALDAAPVALLCVDRGGIISCAVGGLFTEIGVEADDLVGKTVQTVLAEMLQARELARRAADAQPGFTTVYWHGHILEARYTPARDVSTDLVGTVIITNGRERAAVEEQLREAEGRSRWLSEATLEGVLLHETGVILDANQTLATLFGYTMSRIVGMSMFDLISHEFRETAMQKVLEEREEIFEATGVRADGSTFPIKIYGRSIPYQGRMVRVAAIRDISERKRGEKALRESERRYREIFENANDLIYTHDLNGMVTSLNRSAEKLTGYAADAVLGRRLNEIVAPESYAVARNMTRRSLLGERTPAYEVDIVRQDGRRVTLELSTRMLYEDGKPVAVQGIGRDVSERRRMEAELRYRVKFEELIAGISAHFINLPPDEFDTGIRQALEKIGRFAGVDRSYIFLGEGDGRLRKAYEWHEADIAPLPPKLDSISMEQFPWLTEKFVNKQLIHIPHIDELPVEAGVERALFEQYPVQSILAIPMLSGRAFIGFLGLDAVDVQKTWTDDGLAAVRIVGEVFVNALERKRTEQALVESEQRYKLAAMGANDGLWDWDLRTNEVYYSPRWKSMLGFADHELGKSQEEWLKRVHADDVKMLEGELDRHLTGVVPHFECEYRIAHKDGEHRWMLSRAIAVRDVSGVPLRMAGSQTDITVRKAAEARLQFDAMHDALTGLPNRILFLDRLEQAIRRAVRRESFQFAVLFLDLDRFKMVNDSLGHTPGDQLLVSVARRLEGCLRPGDTIARMGGDEFTILTEDMESTADATRVAERVLEALSHAFNLGGQEVFTSASIGIALGSHNYERPEELLRDADTAMYRAKAEGKSRYALFDAPMHARALELLRLETELRRAVEREDFQLLYQPIINLVSGDIAGFEALLRWHHPLRGVMLTSQVIPLAEETGLIIPIGRWVLREACRQMREWQLKFPLPDPLKISVNLSAKQFMQTSLLGEVQQVLNETGIDPTTLRMEITESVLMENADAATAIVSGLKVMKINLHLDDFGTGYSSLSYLHRFPIDTVKIDRSFISRMSMGQEVEIVRTITTLAHHLGKTVIAEGVETEDQLRQLRTLKCEQAQGYLFAKPLDPAEVEALLARDPRW